jgi:ubiquinone/menaquinone biosynthesis C-methylase UbiE
MMAELTDKQVVAANRVLHAAAARNYRKSEPHFRAENVERVRTVLEQLSARTERQKLLDLGCGTGFMLEIGAEFFEQLHGIDISPEMLNQTDLTVFENRPFLHRALTDRLPFRNDTFDMCTAHAVLHHLHDLTPTIRECFRVLKPGGIFYSDLDPNSLFWKALSRLPATGDYHSAVTREINAVLHKDTELAEEFHVNPAIIHHAEPIKHIRGGLCGADLAKVFRATGFSSCTITYEWFLGEAGFIHHPSRSVCAPAVRDYLKEMLPLTGHLFKYLGVRAVK